MLICKTQSFGNLGNAELRIPEIKSRKFQLSVKIVFIRRASVLILELSYDVVGGIMQRLGDLFYRYATFDVGIQCRFYRKRDTVAFFSAHVFYSLQRVAEQKNRIVHKSRIIERRFSGKFAQSLEKKRNIAFRKCNEPYNSFSRYCT